VRIGAHALVWSGEFDQVGIETAVTGAARAGFDHIEFPVFDPQDWDAAHTRALLDAHGLTAAASLGLPEDRNISSADPSVVAAGRDHLYQVLDLLAAFDRIDYPARGRDGGGDGEAGVVALKSGQPLKGKGFQLIPPGERLMVLTPGGAGIGVPRDRDRTQVANDLADGLITSETAEKVYEFKPPQAAE